MKIYVYIVYRLRHIGTYSDMEARENGSGKNPKKKKRKDLVQTSISIHPLHIHTCLELLFLSMRIYGRLIPIYIE